MRKPALQIERTSTVWPDSSVPISRFWIAALSIFSMRVAVRDSYIAVCGGHSPAPTSMPSTSANTFAVNLAGSARLSKDYDAKRRYDLVICHDVMQYLDRPRAMRALEKLGKLTRGALYFSVLTREDWDSNCDQGLTDGATYRRSSDWYRKILAREFLNAGGGLYIKRDADVVLYALEHV